MKRLLSSVLAAQLLLPSFSLLWAKSESQGAQSQPESRSFHSKSMMDEALTLLEIYGKIRRVAGKDDRSELKVNLDRLNGVLDEILSFKESFTPQKLSKVEKQLNRVKTAVTEIGNMDANKMKGQINLLTDSLFELMKVLMESSPEEKK
ncbi:MAG: hypothetical protein U1F57_10700 [bacterium]